MSQFQLAEEEHLSKKQPSCECADGRCVWWHCGCSTCHVHVLEGMESLEEMEDDEDDILGKADDVRHVSRLGCQARVGASDLRVHITRESQIAFVNEHPEMREQFEQQTK